MNPTQYAMTFFLVVIIVVVISLLRQFGPALARAAENAASAVLNAEQRATLYAAVKIGLRAAEAHNISFDQLANKAIEIAANYLKGNNLDVDADLLRDLIFAEQQKKREQPDGLMSRREEEIVIEHKVIEAVDKALRQVQHVEMKAGLPGVDEAIRDAVQRTLSREHA